MKTDFKDSEHWDELAEELMPYRLPEWDIAPTATIMREWLKRLEIKEALFEEAFRTSLSDWIALNHDWPLRAFVGLLLEFKEATRKLPSNASPDEITA